MSLSEWLNKQVHPRHQYYSAAKRNYWYTITWMNPKWKRAILKGYIVCVHVIHSWNENLQQWWTDWGCQRLKGVRLGGKCGYQRATGGIPVVMEMVSILTESVSISWMWYCTIVLQDVTTERNWVKGTELFHTIACESSYHKIQRLKVVLRNYIDGGY